MTFGLWMLRRIAASVTASVIFLAITLLVLISPWETSTPDDTANDSWVHGLAGAPAAFIVLAMLSFVIGTILVQQGRAGIVPFALGAIRWVGGMTILLIAPAAILAAFLESPWVGIGVFACGGAELFAQGMIAAIAWRLVAGRGPSMPPVPGSARPGHAI